MRGLAGRLWWHLYRRWRAAPKVFILRHTEETFEGVEAYRTRRAFYLRHATYVGETRQQLGGEVELLREHVFFIQASS